MANRPMVIIGAGGYAKSVVDPLGWRAGVNCLPFLGLKSKILEMGGFSMTIYDRSARRRACDLFDRGLGRDAAAGVLGLPVEAVRIFCSEKAFECRIQREREDAAFDARLIEAVGRGVADIEAGRYVISVDEAFDRADAMRSKCA